MSTASTHSSDAIVAMVADLREREDHVRVLTSFRKESGALRLAIKEQTQTDAPAQTAIDRICELYVPRERLLDVLITCATAELRAAEVAMFAALETGKERSGAKNVVENLADLVKADAAKAEDAREAS